MLSTLRKEDCGCGGGKTNCITRNVMKRWVNEELKRLDCGCGCKGTSKFVKKYGLVGGKILADCKPGWDQDALTCRSRCNPDEHDDLLSCRKKCNPGQHDDGLTCRNPIQSKMNDCPAGSHDVWGTCWGPGHKWCVDDCFTKPAPGCRTWECGRLKGLFGEDWGPRLCTECNLRCGQTCWHTNVITKQLHERELRIWGGEVNGQAIRWKTVEGRVDFVELGQTIKGGLEYVFSDDGPLARAFDPEKNGVGPAFRKFGDDMKAILEDVGARIKKGFEDFGAAAKKAFEDFGSLVADKFIAFGEGFVAMMKDPMFWAEVIGVLAVIGSTALAIAGTAITAGMGAPAFAALVAASAMAGPAAKMIVKASRGEPIDGLDVANLLISGASAAIPGMSGMTATLMKAGTTAASVIVTGVQVCQGLGLIPSTCIANCPPPFNTETPPEITPKLPPVNPPPAGQKSDDEIMDLAPPNTFKRMLKDPRRENPDYMSEEAWIAKYRKENYGSAAEGPGGELVDAEDIEIDGAIDVTPDAKPIIIDEVETPNPAMPDLGELDDLGDLDLGDLGDLEMPKIEDLAPIGDLDLGDLSGLGRRKRGGADPLLRVVDKGQYLSSFWGSDQAKASENIPKTTSGATFNPTCYKNRNPEIKAETDQQLTTHWILTGSKDQAKFSAECETPEQRSRREAEEREKAKIKEMNGVRKLACIAADRFWDEAKLECDGLRHADGRLNTVAEECKKFGNYWHSTGTINFCDQWKDLDGKQKTRKDKCSIINGHWTGTSCDITKNIDGSTKTDSDYCVGLNNFYDPKTNTCDITKDNDGHAKSEERMCLDSGDFYGCTPGSTRTDCHLKRCFIYHNSFNERKTKKELCENVLLGHQLPEGESRTIQTVTGSHELRGKDACVNMLGIYPSKPHLMKEFIQTKKFSKQGVGDVFDLTTYREDGKPIGSGKSKKSLTLYYAEWCHFCKVLMPIWKKLGSEYKGIKIVAVEEQQNTSFPVDGYPTIVYRDGSRMEKYEGERTKAGIVNFLKSKL